MYRIFTFLLIISVAIFSCRQKDAKTKHVPDKSEVLNADIEFSRYSEAKGMKAAFIEYIDSNGVLLRPNEMPIIGANAIDYLIQQSDTGYSLTWQPNGGDISISGDLGYTFGIYAMRPSSKDTVIYGTYTSIWKKQQDGKWKFVLDSGNEGVGEYAR